MDRMKVVSIALSLGFLLGSPAAGQDGAILPESWHGTWRGPGTVERAGAEPLRFEMELAIGPTSDPGRMEWTMTYRAEDRSDVRPYSLVRDPTTGALRFDEANSIRIDVARFGDTLCSRFEVQGTTLVCRYHLDAQAQVLEVEIATFAGAADTTSGGEGEVPAVRSWRPRSFQRAGLRRRP